jgi:hypothetical protein
MAGSGEMPAYRIRKTLRFQRKRAWSGASTSGSRHRNSYLAAESMAAMQLNQKGLQSWQHQK